MSYFVYVLYSRGHDKFYHGHTQDLSQRLEQHNSGKTASSKPFIPWELVYHEEFITKEEAINREKYFKTAAGRRFLKPIKEVYRSRVPRPTG